MNILRLLLKGLMPVRIVNMPAPPYKPANKF